MMNIQQRTIEQLEKLAAKGPGQVEAIIQNGSQPGYIIGIPPAEGKGAGASVTVENYDRYSVILRRLEVYDNSLTLNGDESRAYLERCAAELSQRVAYLEEPLTLVELDPAEGIAQLRSGAPLAEASQDKAAYWELLVWSSPHPRTRLTRYQWQAGQREREALLYPATFVTLGRLAKDIAASLAEAIGN
jgi:hypothetical protein